jgi:hypothetical protein
MAVRETSMRKTSLHTWIAMFLCVLAVAAEVVQTGTLQLSFSF